MHLSSKVNRCKNTLSPFFLTVDGRIIVLNPKREREKKKKEKEKSSETRERKISTVACKYPRFFFEHFSNYIQTIRRKIELRI